MVSKARLDLPEPDRPVNTVSVSRGISTSTFLRLCSRAPRMEIFFSIALSLRRNAHSGWRAWQPQPRGDHDPLGFPRPTARTVLTGYARRSAQGVRSWESYGT